MIPGLLGVPSTALTQYSTRLRPFLLLQTLDFAGQITMATNSLMLKKRLLPWQKNQTSGCTDVN
jgi:hypothetical protein